MEYIYLLLAMICSAMLSILSSIFKNKTKGKKNVIHLYNLIVSISAFVSWGIISAFDGGFDIGVMLYSVIYGAFYIMALWGMFKAFETGTVSLTSFIKQLSLIGVAVWGFVFWNTKITLNIIIGLALIVASLYFCFLLHKKTGEKTVSFKWFIYAIMLFVGNAACSIIQKEQQLAFDGKSKSMFMFCGMFFAIVICVCFYFGNPRCKFKEIEKKMFLYPIFGGMSSAILNLFIMLLISTTMSESIIFPGIAVGGLIITIIFSSIVFKEKLLSNQWIGLGVGSVALVLLNL